MDSWSRRGRRNQQPASPDDATESIFTVLQQQLGLKLKTGKGPLEFLIIDNTERPTAI
jgi:uncharacterized protein (TIGR03435 family)